VKRVFEKNPNTIKNYSILLRYQSKTGVMNVSKEYRDVSLRSGAPNVHGHGWSPPRKIPGH
jgi:large subunit ribosomal protein L18Ae